jgi:hypothetical protein
VFRESCTVISPKLEREKGDFREQKKYIYRVGWRDVPLDLFCLFFPNFMTIRQVKRGSCFFF